MKAHQLVSAVALVTILAVAGFACGGEDKPTGQLTQPQFEQILGVARESGFTQSEIETLASEMNKVQKSGGFTQEGVEKLITGIRTAKTTAGAVSQPVSSTATTTTKQTVAPTKAATSAPTTQPAATSTPKPAPTRAAPPAPTAPPQPTAVPTPDTVNGLVRLECPDNCRFTAEEAARGQTIHLDDGRVCSGTTDVPCYIRNGPGTVYGGTTNPYNGEVNGKALNQTFAVPASPTSAPANPDTVNGLARRDKCTPATPCSFAAGEAVTGFFKMGGVEYSTNCFMLKTTADGFVTDGTVNPWKNEVAAKTC